MPTIDQHHSSQTVKLLEMGDSGTGKTAALCSLARAGYNLRIIDFDNGLDIVSNLLKDDPAEVKERVRFKTFTDEFKTTRGGDIIPKGEPKAYARACQTLNSWQEDDGTDLGNVAGWGPDDVLVIDSLTFMSNAIMRWHLFKVGRVGNPWPQDWLEAQRKLLSFLDMIYSTSVKCNVVMTAHIRYMDLVEGETQGYPESVGKALPPQIPRFYNTVVQAKIVGSGNKAKRRIKTVPDSQVPLKNAAPQSLKDAELPIETALADIFKGIRGE